MEVIHMFLAKKESYTHVNINKKCFYLYFFSFKHNPSMHNFLLGGCLCMLSKLRCHVSIKTSTNRISTVFAGSCQVLKPVRCIF